MASLYVDSFLLVSDLAAEKSSAIEYVHSQSKNQCKAIAQKLGLSLEAAEEALLDAILLLIRKIQAGEYIPNQAKPVTYLLELCKGVLLNYRKKEQKLKNNDILEESHLQIGDFDTYKHIEAVETLERLLSHLGDPCRNLIELKYLQEFSDEEILAQKLSPYSTADSLRNKRSQCFKKLRQIWSHKLKDLH